MPIVSLTNQADTLDVADLDDALSVHSQIKAAAARQNQEVSGTKQPQRWSPFLSFLQPTKLIGTAANHTASTTKNNKAINGSKPPMPPSSHDRRGSSSILNTMVGSSLKNVDSNADEMSVMTIDSALRDLSLPSQPSRVTGAGTGTGHGNMNMNMNTHRMNSGSIDVDVSLMTDDEVESQSVPTNGNNGHGTGHTGHASHSNGNGSLVGNVVKTVPHIADKSPASTLTGAQTFSTNFSSAYQSPLTQLNNIPENNNSHSSHHYNAHLKSKNRVKKYSTQTYSDKGVTHSYLHKTYAEKSRSKRARSGGGAGTNSRYRSSSFDVQKMPHLHHGPMGMHDDDHSVSSYHSASRGHGHGHSHSNLLIKQYEEASVQSNSVANILMADHLSTEQIDDGPSQVDDDLPINVSDGEPPIVSPDSDDNSQQPFFQDDPDHEELTQDPTQEDHDDTTHMNMEDVVDDDDDDEASTGTSSPLTHSLHSNQSKLEMEIVRLNLELETTHSNLNYANTQIKNYQDQVRSLECLIQQLQSEKDIMKRHLMMLEKKNISKKIKKTKVQAKVQCQSCATCAGGSAGAGGSSSATSRGVKSSRSLEESESSSAPSSSQSGQSQSNSKEESQCYRRAESPNTIPTNDASHASKQSKGAAKAIVSQNKNNGDSSTVTPDQEISIQKQSTSDFTNHSAGTDKDQYSESDGDIPNMASTTASSISADDDTKDLDGFGKRLSNESHGISTDSMSNSDVDMIKEDPYDRHVQSILQAFDEDDPLSDKYDADPFATLRRIDEDESLSNGGDDNANSDEELLLKNADSRDSAGQAKNVMANPMNGFRWDNIFKQRKKA